MGITKQGSELVEIGTLSVFPDKEATFGFSYDISTNYDGHKALQSLDGAKLYVAKRPIDCEECGVGYRHALNCSEAHSVQKPDMRCNDCLGPVGDLHDDFCGKGMGKVVTLDQASDFSRSAGPMWINPDDHDAPAAQLLKALQWIVDNPHAHPNNVQWVAKDAIAKATDKQI